MKFKITLYLNIHLVISSNLFWQSEKTNLRRFQTETACNNNLKIEENGTQFSKWVENTVGKGEIYDQFLFSSSLPKRLVLQTHETKDLSGQGLNKEISILKVLLSK